MMIYLEILLYYNALLFPTHLMCTRHSISERLTTYLWFQPGSVKFILFLQVLLYTFKPAIATMWALVGYPGEACLIWALYIIRVNHFLKSTLIEDEETVPTALWTLQPRVRTGLSLPNFLPFLRIVRGHCPGGSVNLIPFFHIFLFSIPLTR